MSSIRRQSIISTTIIYFGFAIGALNTLLFARKGLFTDSVLGLYNQFIAFATIMMAFSHFGVPLYFYKFFPYYKAHCKKDKNDLLTIGLVTGIAGFLLVTVAGIIFKDFFIRKYSANSPELVNYYFWVFIMGFGLLLFVLLEAYAWQLHLSVFTNFLREVAWRLWVLALILLFLLKYISIGLFLKLFSFSYLAIACILLFYLLRKKEIHFTFSISKTTKRFRKSILRLSSYVYIGSLILSVTLVFDTIVISSLVPHATVMVGVYSFAQFLGSVLAAPQRGIVAASVAHLSQAWKDKNLPRIQQIYQRSSVNQLIFAAGLLSLILLNYNETILTFGLKDIFLQGMQVMVFIGLMKLVDMGTGVNSQIIGTSTYWRFEMLSGIVLLIFILPLSYFLTKAMGIAGTALAQLISITIYNIIRIIFLYRKFRLFPFTIKTLYTLLIAGACFALCYFAFYNLHSWAGLFIRSIVFVLLYAFCVLYMNLSPDIKPVAETITKRLGIKKD